MQSSAELKRQAKESLKGRWGQAVLLNLIPTLIGIVAILLIMIPIILFAIATYDGSANVSDAMASGSGSSGGGGGIISSIISALFMSGISWTYLDVLRGQKDQIEPFKDAFRGFKGLLCSEYIRSVSGYTTKDGRGNLHRGTGTGEDRKVYIYQALYG